MQNSAAKKFLQSGPDNVAERNEARRRLQRVFSRIFETKEINELVSPRAMAKGVHPGHYLDHIGEKKECELRMVAYLAADGKAGKLASGLVKNAEEYDFEIDIAKLAKDDCRLLPGFREFLENCIIPKLVALKVTDSWGKESYPLVFSPHTVLVYQNGPVIFAYNENTDFSGILRELTFR